MTVTKVNLVTDFVGSTQMIRADMIASWMNHRLYRQGRVYDLKLDYDHDGTETVDVYALNPTWLLKESWKLAYKVFQKHTADERALIKDKVARWYDFRIQDSVIGAGVLKPVDYSLPSIGAVYNPIAATNQPAEYAYSTIENESGTTYSFSLDNVGVGTPLKIIFEYLEAYNYQSEPSSTISNNVPYGQLDEDLQDSNVSHLMGAGNDAPYHGQPDHTDRLWVKIGTLGTAAPGVQRLTTGYFEAPLGMVAIQGYTEATPADTKLTLCYKAGNYKGISARSMEEL